MDINIILYSLFVCTYSLITLCVRSLSMFSLTPIQSSSNVNITFCENYAAGLLKNKDKYWKVVISKNKYAESVVQYQTSEQFELLKLYVTVTNTGILSLDG